MTIASLLLTAIWIAYLLRAALYGSKIRQLRDETRTTVQSTPLSIVIAARDERHTLSLSIPKLLAVNYPHVEFILIDDRSRDGTGDLLDTLAENDQRVRVIHILDLPEGWLGKVHALHQGEKRASGEWLLFTDADIHFEPHALDAAVAYAQSHDLDMLSLIPESHETRGILASAFEAAFGTLFVQKAWPPNLPDPDKSDAIGVGAFNLVRRASFDKTPGFEWLRMEVLDDIGVGVLMKRNGFRQEMLFAHGLISFEWYRDSSEMVRGLEKNLFAGFGRYSYVRMTLILLGLLLMAAGPILFAILSGNVLAVLFAAVLQVVVPGLIAATAARGFSIRPTVMSALPLGMLLIVYASARSMLKAWRQKGIRWRDTFYALGELRKMQRVKL